MGLPKLGLSHGKVKHSLQTTQSPVCSNDTSTSVVCVGIYGFNCIGSHEVHVKNSAMFQFQQSHDAKACACKNENVKERCRLHVKTKPAPLSFAILQLLKYVYIDFGSAEKQPCFACKAI